MPRRTPIVQKPLHQIFVLESDVVHVTIHLSVQGDRVRLALGADALGPWGVVFAAVFDATGDVLEG